MTGNLAGNLADDGHVVACKEERIDDPADYHADDQANDGPDDADDVTDVHDDDQDVDMWLRAKKRAPAVPRIVRKGIKGGNSAVR